MLLFEQHPGLMDSITDGGVRLVGKGAFAPVSIAAQPHLAT
jgi:hypothetical protein